MSSYASALESAGATVHAFEDFGSYQGDWWALVTYENRTGWISDSYGSCSGCDAFEHEFGYESHAHAGNDYVSISDPEDWIDACETCQNYKTKLREFGKEYLNDILSQEEAEAKAVENLEWDMDAAEMVKFVREHPVEQSRPTGA